MSGYLLKILRFWSYYDIEKVDLLRERLARIFFGDVGLSERFLLPSNGRVAIYILLKSLGLKATDTVVLQAFTCNSTANPVIWAGAKPRYVDISPSSLNMDLEKLAQAIDESTKAILVQHTFGNLVDIDKVRAVVGKRDIVIIEDCAHAFGVKSAHGVIAGLAGDAAVFSFGLQKVFRTRVGGALLINKPTLLAGVKKEFEKLPKMGYLRVKLWLLDPILWRLARLAPVVRNILIRLRLIGVGFMPEEYTGGLPSSYLCQLPGVLAEIVSDALLELDSNLVHRKELVDFYNSELFLQPVQPFDTEQPGGDFRYGSSFLKYPIFLRTDALRNEFLKKSKIAGLMYGNWYDFVLYPNGTSLEKMQYLPGSCPVAEDISSRIINLPTDPAFSKEYASQLTSFFKSFWKSNVA